jgi:hypothetical protein
MIKLRNSRHTQKGLSTPGWIFVVGLFGLILISILTVFPMYYDNFKVKTVLEAIQNDQAVDSKSKRAIWESLNKRLSIQEVKSIKKEDVAISRKDGKTTVTLTYENKADYIGNLSIVGSFVESVVIDR